MKTEFLCTECGLMKVNESEFTTGYARDKHDNKICFECCGINDRKALINMKVGERTAYYFSKGVVSNWPGTMVINPSYTRTGKHNWGGTKTSFWFTLVEEKKEGEQTAIIRHNFYGYQIGNMNQVAHIRKVKN